MSKLNPTTRHQLQERRQQMRQQLRQKFQSRLWRWTLTAGLLAGGLYTARLPLWKVQLANSIHVRGNDLLEEQDILAFAPPIESLYIWQVEPRQVEDALLENPFLKSVSVRRQLFPPHISARVEERQAIALGQVGGAPGFIDTEGQWVESTGLPTESAEDWPSLTVMGWEPSQKRDWAELLFVLQHSAVEIRTVDWRTPSNLILQTELGEVHFGPLPEGTHPDTPLGRSPLASSVKERLQGLHQLSQVYEGACECQPEDVEYINLSQPRLPTIALTEAAANDRFSSRWLFAPPTDIDPIPTDLPAADISPDADSANGSAEASSGSNDESEQGIEDSELELELEESTSGNAAATEAESPSSSAAPSPSSDVETSGTTSGTSEPSEELPESPSLSDSSISDPSNPEASSEPNSDDEIAPL